MEKLQPPSFDGEKIQHTLFWWKKNWPPPTLISRPIPPGKKWLLPKDISLIVDIYHFGNRLKHFLKDYHIIAFMVTFLKFYKSSQITSLKWAAGLHCDKIIVMIVCP